ncbi:MAG TPA: nitroreductase family protein [Candidatus Dormibacteraeota bacterium]
MDFEEVVRRQRIVRRFERTPVAREVLGRIARAAQRAPTAGFSQGQRLVIVTDEPTRRRVGAAVGEDYYISDGFGDWISACAAQFVPCVSETIYRERYREPDKLAEDQRMGHPTADAASEPEDEWPVPYWWMDIGCTVMLVMLGAINEGLAAGFCGVTNGAAPLRAVLSIPDDMTPVGVIPVGRPLPDKRSPSLARGRLPFDEFARWERWSAGPEL